MYKIYLERLYFKFIHVINELGCCDQPSQMLKNMNIAWGQAADSSGDGKI